jgi:hypothetical protein
VERYSKIDLARYLEGVGPWMIERSASTLPLQGGGALTFL